MPLEKAREDKRAAAWLKTNILLHAYLNNLPVTPAHAHCTGVLSLSWWK